MNPVILGILLRAGLQFIAGLIAAHTGYQASQGDLDTVAAGVEATVGAALPVVGIVLSIRNKKKLGALK